MLLYSGKSCNPDQPDMEENFNQLTENFDFLFKKVQSIGLEMQDNQLKIDRLKNKPNEKITGGYRSNRENHIDRRWDDDDEIVRRCSG